VAGLLHRRQLIIPERGGIIIKNRLKGPKGGGCVGQTSWYGRGGGGGGGGRLTSPGEISTDLFFFWPSPWTAAWLRR
jgi:hypothetical protein